jgi:hypothetical protein
MSQAQPILDPWILVWGQPYIDSRTLAAAIEQDLVRDPDPDFRTRLLVRDAAVALRSFWGSRRFARWVASSPVGQRIRAILKDDLGRTGFTGIRRRLVEAVDSPQLRQIFDLLGRRIERPVEVHIAGSIPTLIKGLTSRPTNDIDFVDEVPPEIRTQRALLRKIAKQYGLTLGHVQSHYLPNRWKERRQWLGQFGGLRVFVVDEYDIFVSKLSSKQEKHQLDLRVLAPKLDRETARQRLLTDGRAFLDDPKLRPQIEENWRFIFQEAMFDDSAAKKAAKGSRPGEVETGSVAREGDMGASRRKRREENSGT